MSVFIDKLAEKAAYLSRAEIEGLICTLLENPGISSAGLVQHTGIPKETLKDFKTAASFLLEPTEKDFITINRQFTDQLKGENLKPYDWSLLVFKDTNLTQRVKEVRKELKIAPKRDFDQFFATEETSASKALILQKKGLLDGANIALLGDDDLVSVAASIASQNVAKLTVFEIDQELTAALKSISAKLGTKNVRCISYDARKEIQEQYLGCFDAVVVDPPYTKSGVTLFLNRSIELLGEKGKYIYLYFGTSFKTPEKMVKVQEIITQMGLVIEDKIDKFARYDGAESIGSASSLYILKTTPFTHILPLSGDFSSLYTYQTSKEEKFPYVDHLVAKLNGVSRSMLVSKTSLLKSLGDFCRTHKLKVVDDKVTKFANGGYTVTFVLSNSNLVVHTWPEYGAIHLDLVTCSPIYNKAHVGETLCRVFTTKLVEVRNIE